MTEQQGKRETEKQKDRARVRWRERKTKRLRDRAKNKIGKDKGGGEVGEGKYSTPLRQISKHLLIKMQ